VTRDGAEGTGLRANGPSSGWFAVTEENVDALPEEVRAPVLERRAHRGRLLAVVQVRVFEHDAHAQVSFPPGATLGVESDRAAIDDVVRRARDELGGWR